MEMMKDDNPKRWDQIIYRWFSYLVLILIVLTGVGLLSGLLMSNTTAMSSTQRLVIGGIVLIYGLARLVSVYVKARKQGVNEKIKSVPNQKKLD
jgi:hypothetical protein